MKERYAATGIPFLRSLNVKQNRIDLTDSIYIGSDFDQELRKSSLTAGTVVVVRTGAPGVSAVIPPQLEGANCSDLVICRTVGSLDPHYAAYFINSTFAQGIVAGFQVGVAQQHFTDILHARCSNLKSYAAQCCLESKRTVKVLRDGNPVSLWALNLTSALVGKRPSAQRQTNDSRLIGSMPRAGPPSSI
jgi:hypothetical protein